MEVNRGQPLSRWRQRGCKQGLPKDSSRYLPRYEQEKQRKLPRQDWCPSVRNCLEDNRYQEQGKWINQGKLRPRQFEEGIECFGSHSSHSRWGEEVQLQEIYGYSQADWKKIEHSRLDPQLDALRESISSHRLRASDNRYWNCPSSPPKRLHAYEVLLPGRWPSKSRQVLVLKHWAKPILCRPSCQAEQRNKLEWPWNPKLCSVSSVDSWRQPDGDKRLQEGEPCVLSSV